MESLRAKGQSAAAHLNDDPGRLGEVPEGQAEEAHQGRLGLVCLRAACAEDTAACRKGRVRQPRQPRARPQTPGGPRTTDYHTTLTKKTAVSLAISTWRLAHSLEKQALYREKRAVDPYLRTPGRSPPGPSDPASKDSGHSARSA